MIFFALTPSIIEARDAIGTAVGRYWLNAEAVGTAASDPWFIAIVGVFSIYAFSSLFFMSRSEILISAHLLRDRSAPRMRGRERDWHLVAVIALHLLLALAAILAALTCLIIPALWGTLVTFFVLVLCLLLVRPDPMLRRLIRSYAAAGLLAAAIAIDERSDFLSRLV